VGFVPAKRRGTGEFLCFLFRLSLFRACACWGAVSFRVFEVWVWDIARVAMLQGGRRAEFVRPSSFSCGASPQGGAIQEVGERELGGSLLPLVFRGARRLAARCGWVCYSAGRRARGSSSRRGLFDVGAQRISYRGGRRWCGWGCGCVPRITAAAVLLVTPHAGYACSRS
jgi:hypothetical protein